MAPNEIIEQFRGVRALVVGDMMLDLYTFGRIERISPEAPVPVFVPEREEERPGGAANVIANLAALGCTATLSGLGDLRTIKHRLFVGHHQVFRIDTDVFRNPNKETIDHLAEQIEAANFDVVVLSDYAKGWVTPVMARKVITAANQIGVPTVVDPKGKHWEKYRGATVICPNQAEWALAGFEQRCGNYLLIKRGQEGLALRQQGSSAEDRFSARAKHVYDVTGAGDTVVAVVAACLAVGASMVDAAILANHAASFVVGEVGTAVCPADMLRNLVGKCDGSV